MGNFHLNGMKNVKVELPKKISISNSFVTNVYKSGFFELTTPLMSLSQA